MYLIAAFGNPLLDITIKISNNNLLTKYKVEEDGQKEVTETEMRNILADIVLYPKKLSAGGCAQNTLRVMQWILNKPNSTVFFGTIGDDEQGKMLKQLVNKDNVMTKYIIDKQHITGTCIAMVKGTNRALIANISAAQHYMKSALQNDEESLSILKSVKMVYIEACFLPNRVKAATYIHHLIINYKKVLAFNLSAAYLFDSEPYTIEHFAKSCHILFGNRKEYEALGKIMNIENVNDVALELSRSFRKYDKSNELLRFGKIVVITNGAKTTKCFYNNGNISTINEPALPPELIVDTTSAGDSFVSGFLAALLLGHDINKCLCWGSWAAVQIIKQLGCNIPDYKPEIM